MSKQRLNIIGISTSNLQTNTFALILEVEESKQRIPIIIGAYEAQSIAIELESMRPSRPLTHDLMKTMLGAFDIKLLEVCINKFKEGVFYSRLTLFDGTKNIEIDSRTSDAVALAVRFDAPIYALEKVISDTAMAPDVNIEEMDDEHQADEPEMNLIDLEKYLERLIQDENYEEASKIRDEINKRKNQ